MSSIYRPKAIHEILPFEVISHTFTFIDPNDLDNGTLPVRLSLVCSAFRDIALATSHIWTRIHVQVLKRVFTEELKEAIKNWIKRSRKHPCRLHLEFSLSRSNYLPPSFLAEFIGPLASRLEALSLRVPARFLDGFFRIKPFEFPLLESFALKFPVDDNSPLVRLSSLSPTAFSGSTSLDRLDLTNTSRLGFFTSQTIFPWHTLTHLKINDLSISTYDALDVFCLSTNLIRCELTIPGWRLNNFATGVGVNIQTSPSGSNPYQPPCIHPNLEVLWLDISCGVIEPFFSRLSLPKLQDFRVKVKRSFAMEDLDYALLELVHRQPMKSLKRLEIQGVSLKGNQGTEPLVRFLLKLPSIETLKLDGCDVFNNAFMQVFIADTENTFLPELKHVCVLDYYMAHCYDGTSYEKEFITRYHKYEWADDKTILAVLESRLVKQGSRGRTRLETVAFSHGSTYTKKFQAKLQELQKRSDLSLSIVENSQRVAKGVEGWLD